MALLALMAFTVFVVDYGTLWLARGQAQNAADAAAHAAAIALAYDNSTDLSDTGPGKRNAYTLSQVNPVFGQAPSVNISTDITYPNCPPPHDPADVCVRVDVYRNQARANPLPVFFGGLVGLTDQGIRATAMAQVKSANASDCLKPFAIPDKWLEFNPTAKPTWEDTDRYEVTDKFGKPLPTPDVYRSPWQGSPTGFTLAGDHGRRVILKEGNAQQAIGPGHYYPVVLESAFCKAKGRGADCFRENIINCVGDIKGIGDPLTVEPGGMIGPTRQGIDALIAMDPNARWDPISQTVTNSCVTTGGCPQGKTYPYSPRIIAIPIFDTAKYETGGRTVLEIVNILGYFLDKRQSNDIYGFLHTMPALYNINRRTLPDTMAFAKVIMLVR